MSSNTDIRSGRPGPERPAPAADRRESRAPDEHLGRRLLRGVGLIGLTVLAPAVAVAGTFIHAAMVHAGAVPIPYGLVLALAGLAAVLVLAHKVARGRLGIVPVTVTWLLPVWLLAQERPGGDIVIADGWVGLTYLFTGVVLVGIGVGLPQR